jgi:hypothetical protein
VAMRRRLAVRLLIMTGAVVLAGMLYVVVFTPTTAVGQDPALVVYEHTYYQGVSSAFSRSDPDLRNNRVGNDAVSSLAIDPGCHVRLWEHTNYTGAYITFDANKPDLNRYNFNDITSSLSLVCYS